MASTIRIKRSSVAGKSPNTSNLSTGELALNLADKKIFSSNGTSVFELGSDSYSPKKTFYVSASGSSAYQFYGAGTGADFSQANSNPTLYLTRGETYSFNIIAAGHPFYINTNNATGTGNQFANGVIGQGTQVGELVFTVPMNAPNKLYYNCQYHSSMNGTIYIPNEQDIDASTFQTKLEAVASNNALVSLIEDRLQVANVQPLLDRYLQVANVNFGTAGQILVVGANNNSISSDSTLAIDTSNNRLGINQASPDVTLHMTGEGAQTAQIRMEQYNDSADAPDLRTRRYRGTISSPSAVSSGDYLYRSNHEYWNGSSLIVGGSFAFDNTNNANRTQFAVSVTTDGTSADPNNASKTQFKIDGNNSGAITFNNAYTFPTSDGSNGQVLQTDGSGNLSFAAASGGSSSPANTFSTINIAGQNSIFAEAAGDTLTFVAGAGVTLTSNSAADSVTIATTVQDDTVAMAIALG